MKKRATCDNQPCMFSRCAPLFTVITRVLMGYLAASRAMLSQHILANSNPGKNATNTSSMNSEQEREELKAALLAAQESSVVQILLEVCLLTPEERQVRENILQMTILYLHLKGV